MSAMYPKWSEAQAILDRQVEMIKENEAKGQSSIINRTLLIGQLMIVNATKAMPRFAFQKYMDYINSFHPESAGKANDKLTN